MPRRTTCAELLLALALVATSCDEPLPVHEKLVEPRRPVHPGTHEPGIGDLASMPEPMPVTGRDPKLDRALAILRGSKLRFLAPDADLAKPPAEYTAEQFASMLESKRDWVGYDITSFDLWLDEIATEGFLDHVAYLVVLDDGTTREVRGWLLEQLAQPAPQNPTPP